MSVPAQQQLQKKFSAAARRHDFNAIMDLVAQGGSPDTLIAGQPLLIYAVTQGQAALATRLIDAGANLEGADKDGNTALMVAAGHGNLDMIEMLLEKGADPLAKNKQGNSAYEVSERERKNLAHAEDMLWQDMEVQAGRYTRARSMLIAAELDAKTRRQIGSCHDGIETSIIVGKPFTLKR